MLRRLLLVLLLVGRLLVAGLLHRGGLVARVLLSVPVLAVGARALLRLPVPGPAVGLLALRGAALRGLLPVGGLGTALGRVLRLALLSALLLTVRGLLRVLPFRPVRRLVLPVGIVRHLRWSPAVAAPSGVGLLPFE
ncbi:hypothetical protein GCM10010493_22440 [Streptomyces lavendulae subsp. grasserius]